MQPLFAAGHDFGYLVFVLIAFGMWVFNLITGKARGIPPVAGRPRPMARPPAPPRPDKLQDEITIFLQEAQGPRATAPPAAPRRPEPPRKPPAPRKLSTAGDDVARRPVPGSADLGAAVREHLAGHLPTAALHQKVAQDLKDRIGESVTEHLGQSRPPAEEGPARRAAPPAANANLAAHTPAHAIQMLRSPGTIKDAFLLNIILAPCRTRRTSLRD